MKLRSSDTIAAIATPLGEGAISIVRLSGSDAISIADKVFRTNHTLSETPGYMIRHGAIVDLENQVVDEVLASVFRSPNSYTGEDSVEIGCHGGVFVTKKVLASLIEAGARQADPGEFTKRAFLNGKIDLSQAEAVSDLIRAGSERALRNSTAQLLGVLGGKVRSLRSGLTEVCALLELQLDFGDDDVQIATNDVIRKKILGCAEELQLVLSSFKVGKVIREGASVAIVGRPNVGKSSLFNRLLLEDRSIVSATPGTTRDFLEESVVIDGTLVRLIDTAGIRPAMDDVEADGIRRAKEAISAADLVLLVLDSTKEANIQDERAIILENINEERNIIVARNKIDISENTEPNDDSSIGVSALTGKGVDFLRERIKRVLIGEGPTQSSEFSICSSRHNEAFRNCLVFVEKALESLDSGLTGEFVAADIRSSLNSLAEVTGEVTTDEILTTIFSKFCIGK